MDTLKQRFLAHPERHPGVGWETVEAALKSLGIAGEHVCRAFRDGPTEKQRRKRLLDRPHAHVGTGLYGRRNLRSAAGRNQVRDTRRVDQHLRDRMTASAIGGRQQMLRHDTAQRHGQLMPD